MLWGRSLIRCAAMAAMLQLGAWAHAQDTGFAEGQAVEVREEDGWSPAKVVRRDRRGYLVRYDEGADEQWVAAFAVRMPGGRVAAAPPVRAATSRPTVADFTIGQKVDSKRGTVWWPARVAQVQDGWIQVLYDPALFYEWVEPWRLRPGGSDEDSIGRAPLRNQATRAGDPPPRIPPKAGPGLVAVRLLRAPTTNPAGVSGISITAASVAGRRWGVGQQVEAKYMVLWRPAVVLEQQRGWVRVQFDHLPIVEWLESWRLRIPQSTYDFTDIRLAGGGDLPRAQPAAPPSDATGDPFKGDVDLSGYRNAVLETARVLPLTWLGKWNATPAAVSARPAKTFVLRGDGEAVVPQQVVASRSRPVAAVLSRIGAGAIGLDVRDLENGSSLAGCVLPIGKRMQLADVSDDGTHVLLVRSSGEQGGNDLLEIWSLKSSSPVQRLCLVPYDRGGKFERDVRFACLLGNDRVLTAGGWGELILWDVATGSALYRAPCDDQAGVSLSSGNRYLAFSTGNDALLIEPVSGDVVGKLPDELTNSVAFAFTPGNRQLLAASETAIYVVDLADGKTSSEFSIPGNQPPTEIAGIADGYALVDRSTLVDLRLRRPLWQYSFPASSAMTVMADGTVLLAGSTGSDPRCVLGAAPVLQPGALEVASTMKADESVLVAPGSQMSVKLSLPLSPYDRRRALRYLNRQAAAKGLRFGMDGTATLELTREELPSETRPNPTGSPLRGPVVQGVRRVLKVRILSKGKLVWERSSEADSPQQVGPMARLFRTIELPTFLACPPEKMGRSVLTFPVLP